MKLFVSDVSGVKEEVSVEASCSHTAFLEMVSEKFGRCVPRKRPVFASIVRDGARFGYVSWLSHSELDTQEGTHRRRMCLWRTLQCLAYVRVVRTCVSTPSVD